MWYCVPHFVTYCWTARDWQRSVHFIQKPGRRSLLPLTIVRRCKSLNGLSLYLEPESSPWLDVFINWGAFMGALLSVKSLWPSFSVNWGAFMVTLLDFESLRLDFSVSWGAFVAKLLSVDSLLLCEAEWITWLQSGERGTNRTWSCDPQRWLFESTLPVV